MTPEAKNVKLDKLNDELLKWQRRLFRAAREVEARVKARQRLLRPSSAMPATTVVVKRTGRLSFDVEHLSADDPDDGDALKKMFRGKRAKLPLPR